MLTKEELEAKARADYASHLGKEVYVKAISGWLGHAKTLDIVLDPPALVKVGETDDGDVARWMDDWLDPVFDVTLVQPHPQLKDMEAFWIYGTSYHADGTERPGDIVNAG